MQPGSMRQLYQGGCCCATFVSKSCALNHECVYVTLLYTVETSAQFVPLTLGALGMSWSCVAARTVAWKPPSRDIARLSLTSAVALKTLTAATSPNVSAAQPKYDLPKVAFGRLCRDIKEVFDHLTMTSTMWMTQAVLRRRTDMKSSS